MSKIEEFQIWAKKFIAIGDSHTREFLNSLDHDLDLHEMKSIFSTKYQNRIEFSYLLGTEYKKLQVNKHSGNDLPKNAFGEGLSEKVDEELKYKNSGDGLYGVNFGKGFGGYGTYFINKTIDNYGKIAKKNKPLFLHCFHSEPPFVTAIFPGEVYVLGRSPNYADIVLPNITVNRRHARICYFEGKCTIEDLKSACGVYINGSLINNATILQVKDYIGIAQTRLVLSNSK